MKTFVRWLFLRTYSREIQIVTAIGNLRDVPEPYSAGIRMALYYLKLTTKE